MTDTVTDHTVLKTLDARDALAGLNITGICFRMGFQQEYEFIWDNYFLVRDATLYNIFGEIGGERGRYTPFVLGGAIDDELENITR
jgi:hypothetical protein